MSRYLTRCAITKICVLCLFLPAIVSAQATQDITLTELVKGRAVALIRHATAPGLGDPSGFRISDCTTQRNLSQEGRDQARHHVIVCRQAGYHGHSPGQHNCPHRHRAIIRRDHHLSTYPRRTRQGARKVRTINSVLRFSVRPKGCWISVEKNVFLCAPCGL
jgi:hypothetical protein